MTELQPCPFPMAPQPVIEKVGNCYEMLMDAVRLWTGAKNQVRLKMTEKGFSSKFNFSLIQQLDIRVFSLEKKLKSISLICIPACLISVAINIYQIFLG